MIREEEIKDFWEQRPYGSQRTTSLWGTKEFFEEAEPFWYRPPIVPFKGYSGKKVLEIGVGLGTDLLLFAEGGAKVTGIDITFNSLRLTRQRFEINPGSVDLAQAKAGELPFADNSFDFVYSHGVLHHIVKVEEVAREIKRVLKPGGCFMVMIYHKHSYYYYGSIMFFKKIGFRLLGWWDRNEFTEEEWLAYGTDYFGNPYSKLYTRQEARELFKEFNNLKTEVYYLCSKDIPLIGRFIPKFLDEPLGRLFGFLMYVSGEK